MSKIKELQYQVKSTNQFLEKFSDYDMTHQIWLRNKR